MELCEIINEYGEPLFEPGEKPDDPRKVISFGHLFNVSVLFCFFSKHERTQLAYINNDLNIALMNMFCFSMMDVCQIQITERLKRLKINVCLTFYKNVKIFIGFKYCKSTWKP